MSFQTSALILSWIAILLLALVVSGLVRQVHALSSGLVQRRPESVGLPPGAQAPSFARLAPVPPPLALVLLFLEPDCGICTEVLTEAAEQTGRAGLDLRVLYRTEAPLRAADLPVAVLDGQADLFDQYDVVATPFATAVDPTGRVLRAAPLGSRTALRRLLDDIDTPAAGQAGPTPITIQPGGRA